MHERLRAVAVPQGGALTRPQVESLANWRQLRRLRAAGDLVRVARGAYALAGSATDLPSRLVRLAVQLDRPVIACRQTAAQLHGFGVVDDGLLHVTHP